MGIAKWKAKLRAWLIDLVREAIRIERAAESLPRFRKAPDPPPFDAKTVKVIIELEPSFEQMQAEAIREQEKYYEPKHARL